MHRFLSRTYYSGLAMLICGSAAFSVSQIVQAKLLGVRTTWFHEHAHQVDGWLMICMVVGFFMALSLGLMRETGLVKSH